MNYVQLQPADQYAAYAEQLYQREVEFFNYQVDVDNFNNIIAGANDQTDPNFLANIKQRLADTLTQQNIVSAIYAALNATIPDQTQLATAIATATTNRSAIAANNLALQTGNATLNTANPAISA